MYVPNKDALLLVSMAEFMELHSIHWGLNATTELSNKSVVLNDLW
jgi:hypothetical protein